MDEIDSTRQAELKLCSVFGLQVPAHIAQQIKRRLFTIAARDNADKVTPEIAKLLEQVGAYVPIKIGDTIRCFGVLWEKNHRICSTCGLQDSCMISSKNIGLDSIKISPRLLGTKLTRTPWLLDASAGTSEESIRSLRVVAKSYRDEELIDYLNSHFVAVIRKGEIYYQLPEKLESKDTCVFCVGKPEKVMTLRFCSPTPDIQAKLTQVNKTKGLPAWVLPDELSLDDAISLINQHVATILI